MRRRRRRASWLSCLGCANEGGKEGGEREQGNSSKRSKKQEVGQKHMSCSVLTKCRRLSFVIVRSMPSFLSCFSTCALPPYCAKNKPTPHPSPSYTSHTRP